MPLATEPEIQQSYRSRETADRYVDQRFTSELMRLLHERQVGAVNRVIREQSPERTLEIAPGPGRITRDIKTDCELVCLEFNQGMIDVGRAACDGRAAWLQGNAFALPFKQEFDFAYSFRFIRHFRRDDRQRLYEQVRGVLRPGGAFVMDAVNARVSAPLREQNPEAYPIYDKLYESADELRAELAEAGFEVIRLEAVQRRFGLQYRTQILLGPRSQRLCRWAIRGLEALPGGAPLEWIVTCRRA